PKSSARCELCVTTGLAHNCFLTRLRMVRPLETCGQISLSVAGPKGGWRDEMRSRAARPMPNRTGRVAVSVVLTFLISLPSASAQIDERPRLAEVVITATRTPESSTDTTSSIEVITGTDIDQHQHAFVSDALRGVPGVDVT